MAQILSRRNSSKRRRGAALTELAICLPILSIVTLGAIEAANGIYVRQRLVAVAYDLARSSTTPGDQSAKISAKAKALFKTYGLKNASVKTTPANLATVKPGEPITITVTAPMSKNSIGLTRLYGKVTSTASLTMTKG